MNRFWCLRGQRCGLPLKAHSLCHADGRFVSPIPLAPAVLLAAQPSSLPHRTYQHHHHHHHHHHHLTHALPLATHYHYATTHNHNHHTPFLSARSYAVRVDIDYLVELLETVTTPPLETIEEVVKIYRAGRAKVHAADIHKCLLGLTAARNEAHKFHAIEAPMHERLALANLWDSVIELSLKTSIGSPAQWTLLIHKLLDVRHPREAMHLISRFETYKIVSPDYRLYTRIASTWAQMGQPQQVFGVINEMQARNIPLSTTVFLPYITNRAFTPDSKTDVDNQHTTHGTNRDGGNASDSDSDASDVEGEGESGENVEGGESGGSDISIDTKNIFTAIDTLLTMHKVYNITPTTIAFHIVLRGILAARKRANNRLQQQRQRYATQSSTTPQSLRDSYTLALIALFHTARTLRPGFPFPIDSPTVNQALSLVTQPTAGLWQELVRQFPDLPFDYDYTHNYNTHSHDIPRPIGIKQFGTEIMDDVGEDELLSINYNNTHNTHQDNKHRNNDNKTQNLEPQSKNHNLTNLQFW
eukprot:TRINITY_DN6383_c2_g1_i1.p1 TRINITY_DN6383_c2_g1~~TRINITY_DN6383_c2_g1_i1.p1  ORF type:complete len:528 (+),score=98.43 TRINITY_DN6383_c2_g1_i1:2-1585(+)